MRSKIEIGKKYLTRMGKCVVIAQVGASHPGSQLLCDYSVTGLIVDCEANGEQEQVSHYAEWDEHGVNKDGNNDLIEACPDKRDDLIIDAFL